MRLFDTAREAVVPFEPGPVATLYTCGITPYDATHMGHATVYTQYDVLQRRLIDLGHEVRCVRNITDVDDSILTKARQLGVHYLDLAAGEVARFHDDVRALDLLPCSEPRATSAIPDIRGFIGMVLDQGHAYQAGGGVYFDVSTSPQFGSLSHYDEARMLEYARERGGNVDDPNKRHPLDFVLWQPSAPDEPAWETMWGPGRPGWHIECSALALRELGTTIDLHGGGADLDLPAPRVRAGPERGGHRRALRAPLDARGHGAQGRREDVEEPREPRVRRRPAPRRTTRWRSASASSSTTTATAGSGTTRSCRGPRPGSTVGAASGSPSAGGKALDEVRAALDDDLDAPRAVAAIDDAVERGEGVQEAAALLGVTLTPPH